MVFLYLMCVLVIITICWGVLLVFFGVFLGGVVCLFVCLFVCFFVFFFGGGSGRTYQLPIALWEPLQWTVKKLIYTSQASKARTHA